MTCPFCGGTDVGHTTSGKGICLDCEETWTTKGERQVRAAERKMDWYDKLND
jgi:ribosomal protein L37AE/L43A